MFPNQSSIESTDDGGFFCINESFPKRSCCLFIFVQGLDLLDLGFSLLSFFSGPGDRADGDCTEDESGVCAVLDNRVFFSAGCAAFGGRPGPRFSPVWTSCVRATIYDGCLYRSGMVVGWRDNVVWALGR